MAGVGTASVGIDVGGSLIKAVRLDSGGNVEESVRVDTPPQVESILDQVADLAVRVGDGIPVGVGFAGLVDANNRILRWAPHLPGVDVAVGDLLDLRLGRRATNGRRVRVDNDANLAAWAEYRLGAGRGYENVVVITLGTGIGMGLILDGEIRHGRAHAGEVGHIRAVADGETCECGRTGCWETMVSGRRLDADARSVLGVGATAADLVEAANRGDVGAGSALTDAGIWLGWGLETVAMSLDPELIVVGGGVMAAGEALLAPARQRMEARKGREPGPSIEVRAGMLGPYAGAIGAALVAVGD